jgi:pimeloyl-ACP methyl ester carboxylesterase
MITAGRHAAARTGTSSPPQDVPTLATNGDLQLLVESPPAGVPERQPLLFVHGYFADAEVWTPMLQAFAALGYPSHAVHLRGRAGSRPGTDLGRASIADFADDVQQVARSLGRPVIVGHSMGGLIAQVVATRGATDALVLFAPAPPRGIPVMTWRLARKQLRYMPAVLASRAVHPHREDLRDLVMNGVPAAEQDALLDLLQAESGRAGRDLSITGVPVPRQDVHARVLVFGGTEDRFIPIGRIRRVAARYGAPLIVLPGRGHMLIREPGWADLVARVDEWLRQATP